MSNKNRINYNEVFNIQTKYARCNLDNQERLDKKRAVRLIGSDICSKVRVFVNVSLEFYISWNHCIYNVGITRFFELINFLE